MSNQSNGEMVLCERYHGSLPIKLCILRHRLEGLSGCQKCTQGEDRERAYGSEYPANISALARTAATYVTAAFSAPIPYWAAGNEEPKNEKDLT